MKRMGLRKIAGGFLLALIAASAASAQNDNLHFSQRQADRLSPGFSRACSAEIAGAMAHAGDSLSDSANIANLNSMVGESIQALKWQQGDSQYRLSLPYDGRWTPIHHYLLCEMSYILNHWDDTAGVASAPAAPPAGRVQPQPALVPTAAPETAQDRQAKEVNAKWKSRYDAIRAKFQFVGCAGIAEQAAEDRCSKTYYETNYNKQIETLALIRELGPLASPGYFNDPLSKVKDSFKVILAGCAEIATSSSPCDLSSGNTSRPPLKSRVIARDGRRAMDCVKLEQLAQSNSSTSGGGVCSPINAATPWKSDGAAPAASASAAAATRPLSLPDIAGQSMQITKCAGGACHGANTLHGDPGSKGLQFTCSAPDK